MVTAVTSERDGLRIQLRQYYREYVAELRRAQHKALDAGVVFTDQEQTDIQQEIEEYERMIKDGPAHPYIEVVDSLFDWSDLPKRIGKAVRDRETDSMTYLHEAFDEVKA